jgi:hypothetical protein
MKTQYCDECQYREWVGESGLACKQGHKPRFYRPRSDPYWQNWGWKRKCADFVLGDHVHRLTPSNDQAKGPGGFLPGPA